MFPQTRKRPPVLQREVNRRDGSQVKKGEESRWNEWIEQRKCILYLFSCDRECILSWGQICTWVLNNICRSAFFFFFFFFFLRVLFYNLIRVYHQYIVFWVFFFFFFFFFFFLFGLFAISWAAPTAYGMFPG